MKLLVDMNLSPRWVSMLTAAGFEAAHWLTLGKGSASDTEIMAFARHHDYIILTHDLDFSAILAATRGLKPSVVQIRTERTSPELNGEKVIAVLHQMTPELESGALLTIETARSRLRVLPLL